MGCLGKIASNVAYPDKCRRKSAPLSASRGHGRRHHRPHRTRVSVRDAKFIVGYTAITRPVAARKIFLIKPYRPGQSLLVWRLDLR